MSRTNKNIVQLEGHDDLVIVLRRMTTKTLFELKEATGTVDFSDSLNSFYFTNREIALQIGGDSKQIRNVICNSDLDYVHKGSEVVTWLDDLRERVEAFALKYS